MNSAKLSTILHVDIVLTEASAGFSDPSLTAWEVVWLHSRHGVLFTTRVKKVLDCTYEYGSSVYSDIITAA